MKKVNKYPRRIIIRYNNVDTYNDIGEIEIKSIEIELTDRQVDEIVRKTSRSRVVFIDATIKD